MSSAVMNTYARAPVAFERGEGAYLHGEDGRRFLDFGAGIAVAALGHAHPHLVGALREQAAKLWHCSNLYEMPLQKKLAARLCAKTFMDKVFFCNSGAEALECGIKMVRRYMDHVGKPERYRIVTLEGAFHGRTLATIAAGRQAKHLVGFDPVVDGFDQAPFGDMRALKAAIGPETAAILVEPIQGEGGIRPLETGWLRELRAVADAFGLVLFFDEVQTGMGRTGKLFAHEWAGVAPDIMAMAKGLGGGFPVGACGASDKIAEAMKPGAHGSTFGGNPLAMAVGNAVVDVIEEPGFLDRVQAMGEKLWDGLVALAERSGGAVEGVRGAGLMIGLRCGTVNNVDLVSRFLDQGLLTVPAGDNVVRLLPPLIVGEAEIREALDKIEAALEAEGGKAA